jgi:uncharacterized membrane protein YeaQ/YmgE (transglycosylase-associated protein family)
MSIFLWITFGILAAVVAHFLDPFKAKGGLFGAILLGVAGATVGGILANVIFGGSIRQFDFITLLVAVAGTFLFLLVQRTALIKK